MSPVTLQQIANEWASKLLAGRESIPVDWSEVPGAREDYVAKQSAKIREQAAIAAAAWARRCGRDPDELPDSVVGVIAAKIATRIVDTVTAQLAWDVAVQESIGG